MELQLVASRIQRRSEEFYYYMLEGGCSPTQSHFLLLVTAERDEWTILFILNLSVLIFLDCNTKCSLYPKFLAIKLCVMTATGVHGSGLAPTHHPTRSSRVEKNTTHIRTEDSQNPQFLGSVGFRSGSSGLASESINKIENQRSRLFGRIEIDGI